MYFSFFTCEVKCGVAALDIALTLSAWWSRIIESMSIFSPSAMITTSRGGLTDSRLFQHDFAVSNVGKHIFYKDVYAFVDRLKDLSTIKDEERLRSALSQCLSDMEKAMLRTTTLELWTTFLIKRFKERTPAALTAIQTTKYTMEDARKGKAQGTSLSQYSSIGDQGDRHVLFLQKSALSWLLCLYIPANSVRRSMPSPMIQIYPHAGFFALNTLASFQPRLQAIWKKGKKD